jgi:hypothetical protein
MTQLFFYSPIVARTDYFHFTVLKPNLFKVKGFCDENFQLFLFFIFLIHYLIIFLRHNHSKSTYTSCASAMPYVVLNYKEPGNNLKNCQYHCILTFSNQVSGWNGIPEHHCNCSLNLQQSVRNSPLITKLFWKYIQTFILVTLLRTKLNISGLYRYRIDKKQLKLYLVDFNLNYYIIACYIFISRPDNKYNFLGIWCGSHFTCRLHS